MAKLYYEPFAGNTKLRVYEDPDELVYDELQAHRDALLEVQGDSDALRTEMALGGLPGLGIPPATSLQEFDDSIQAELDRIFDILDYGDYDTTAANLTVVSGDWFLPEALESVSNENAGEEGGRAIDNDGTGPNNPDNSTWWQSNINGTRTIVFRLRSYVKRVTAIRVRVPNASSNREQLQDVTVKASPSVAAIDDAGNVMGEGVNFTHGGSSWVEFTFPGAGKPNVRYLKLEIPTSLHTNSDHIRIRSLQARVGIINHNK